MMRSLLCDGCVEHPVNVRNGYLEECVDALKEGSFVIPDPGDWDTWLECHNGVVFEYNIVHGNSGQYLIVTSYTTGEVVQDDRPWQMKV